MWATAPNSSHQLLNFFRRHCSAQGIVTAFAAWEELVLNRSGQKHPVNPNFFSTWCVQELNESTPAAHVLSVCAYFPNLDMGSELQAQRVYVKLAWLSPFHSPDLAVAQHRDALHRWDYWLQRASCLKPSPRGTGWAERCPGTPLLPSHCFLPFRRAVEGRKSAAVAPPFLRLEDLLHPSCALGSIWASFLLLCYHHLAGE